MKPCKSNQETSEEVLFIKSRQIAQQNPFYRGLMLKLDRTSIEVEYVKNYKITIFKSDFTHIHEYLCRVSFLTTLGIYNDYFKGRLKWCKKDATWCKVIIHAYCDQRQFALVHHTLSRSYYVFAPRVLWPRSFLILIIGWTKELCSQHLPQIGVLVTYWDLCIIS